MRRAYRARPARQSPARRIVERHRSPSSLPIALLAGQHAAGPALRPTDVLWVDVALVVSASLPSEQHHLSHAPSRSRSHRRAQRPPPPQGKIRLLLLEHRLGPGFVALDQPHRDVVLAPGDGWRWRSRGQAPSLRRGLRAMAQQWPGRERIERPSPTRDCRRPNHRRPPARMVGLRRAATPCHPRPARQPVERLINQVAGRCCPP